MLTVHSNTIIYILCPSKSVSGGPESLHQLVHALKTLELDARLMYRPEVVNPTPPEYSSYSIAIAKSFDTRKENILIIPEVWSHLNLSVPLQTAIWWLSVANAPGKGEKTLFDFSSAKTYRTVHLAGSAYANDFLNKNGARKICSLPSGPVNVIHSTYNNDHQKENIVLYNAKKGKDITNQLVLTAPDITWIPIEKLTAPEVSHLMSKSKVYIDFGHHPGKERMPREAARHDCCVIVGKKGSASFYNDVPIPEEYKHDVEPLNVAFIVQQIRDCLNNYAKRIKDFENYKKIIAKEPEVFLERIKKVFHF